jgi:peptidoglycan/xylan/chitin deacetylase (PgdA/CDA1 family)
MPPGGPRSKGRPRAVRAWYDGEDIGQNDLHGVEAARIRLLAGGSWRRPGSVLRMKRRSRKWRLGLAAVAVTLAAAGAIALTQPLWTFDLAVRAAPGILWRVDTSEPLVALTFDDGPAPGHTSVVLDLLARHEARATFFMLGERAEAHPALVEAVRERGHEIGNHGFADRRTVRLSGDELLADLRRTDEMLQLQGPERLYRPPSGLITPSQLALVREHGYRCVLGSAYPFDPAHPPSAYIRWLVVKNLAPGVIVVLHDGIPDPSRTLAVLDDILAAGRGKGLRFVTVSELLGSG